MGPVVRFRPLWSPVNRSWYLEFLMGQISAFYDWQDFGELSQVDGRFRWETRQTRSEKLALEIRAAEEHRENNWRWVEMRRAPLQ